MKMKINILSAVLFGAALWCSDAVAQGENQQQNQTQQTEREAPATQNREGLPPPVGRDEDTEAFVDAKYSIAEVVGFDQELNTFQKAYYQAGIEAALHKAGPYTVFAPTDAAFLEIPATQLQQLMSPEYSQQLLAFISSHIVEGNISIEDLSNGQKLRTIDGKELTVKKVAKDVSINGARISVPNIKAQNGIMHKIEGLILPSVKD
jgi:uncharacterized surface protein with fasciclin (FAS1) repeats